MSVQSRCSLALSAGAPGRAATLTKRSDGRAVGYAGDTSNWSVNVGDSRNTAYKVLAAELRDAILADEFPPGQRLPTEAELAAVKRLSRHTVRAALSELVSEGLIYRVPGLGTFAAPTVGEGGYFKSIGSIEDLIAIALDTELEVIEPFAVQADVAAASRLKLRTERLMVGEFTRSFDNIPFSEVTSYVPLDVGQRLVADGTLAVRGTTTPHTIIGLIERAWPGIKVAGAQQTVTAVLTTPRIQELLQCGPADPVLRIERLYYDRMGKMLQLAVNHFNPKRYAYRLEMRR